MQLNGSNVVKFWCDSKACWWYVSNVWPFVVQYCEVRPSWSRELHLDKSPRMIGIIADNGSLHWPQLQESNEKALAGFPQLFCIVCVVYVLCACMYVCGVMSVCPGLLLSVSHARRIQGFSQLLWTQTTTSVMMMMMVENFVVTYFPFLPSPLGLFLFQSQLQYSCTDVHRVVLLVLSVRLFFFPSFLFIFFMDNSGFNLSPFYNHHSGSRYTVNWEVGRQQSYCVFKAISKLLKHFVSVKWIMNRCIHTESCRSFGAMTK